MRTIVSGTFFLSWLMSSAFSQQVEPGRQVANPAEGDRLGYWLYVPGADQAKPAAGWPLILFLHGAGERGNDLEQVKVHGPPRMVAKMDVLKGCIIVSPQCPKGRWWEIKKIKAVLDEVKKKTRPDPKRLYVTGLSMGGFGSWGMLETYPREFAAAIPICGGGNPRNVKKFKHVPIRVFHGDKDRAVKVEKSREMVEALKKAGGKVEYTEIAGGGHDVWTDAYKDEALYAWLLKQKK